MLAGFFSAEFMIILPSANLLYSPSGAFSGLSPVTVPSGATFFFFGLAIPWRSSWFRESPYFLSKVSNFSVSGKRLKSLINYKRVSFLISANYWRI